MNLFQMALIQFDRAASHMDLNDGLYRFKSEFGGGGVAHVQYTLAL